MLILCIIFCFVLVLVVTFLGNPFKTIIENRVKCPNCGWHRRAAFAPMRVVNRKCPKCMHPAPGSYDYHGWKVLKMKGTPVTNLGNPFTWWRWKWDEVD